MSMTLDDFCPQGDPVTGRIATVVTPPDELKTPVKKRPPRLLEPKPKRFPATAGK